jgi:hypothetical protein
MRNWHTKTEESTKKNPHNQQVDTYCELTVLSDNWDERVANGTLPDFV